MVELYECIEQGRVDKKYGGFIGMWIKKYVRRGLGKTTSLSIGHADPD